MRLRYSSAVSRRGSGPPNHAMVSPGGKATVKTLTSWASRLGASSMIRRRRLRSCSDRQWRSVAKYEVLVQKIGPASAAALARAYGHWHGGPCGRRHMPREVGTDTSG